VTGWPAVFATTGLMVVALLGFNIRLWRRMRAATEAAKREQAAKAAASEPDDRSA
jgi:F0F1-type ATP synthase assembly protein I